jgi:hypothetical protein
MWKIIRSIAENSMHQHAIVSTFQVFAKKSASFIMKQSFLGNDPPLKFSQD